MNIIADRVKERISGSPGTSSTLTLSAAPIGFRRFSSVMSIGDTCYAVIENGAAWEIGIYTYSAANTLTRTTVLKSSNSGALISVGSNAFVFISYIADKAVYLNPSGEANLALTTLNDVSLTAPASGESLKYNGSSWVNGVVAGYTTEEAQDAVGGILTDTSSISFSYNDGAPSIAASVRSSGITDVMISGGIDATKIGSGSVSSAEFGYLDGVTSSLQVQLDSKYGSANPSGYLTASVASATYAVIAAGQPISGTIGQVLAKNSGANYDSSWSSLVLGDRYLSTSTTSNAVSNGTKTFTIGTGLAYTPTQNITIAYDATNHMHGEVTTYNSGTGVLVVDINNHTGTGTYTSWVVNVGGVTPATVVSWGDIIGTLGTQSDLSDALNAKLEITTAASTYLPLAGGTLTGDLKFTDATYDIGKSGATRPRDGFFSRNLTVATSISIGAATGGVLNIPAWQWVSIGGSLVRGGDTADGAGILYIPGVSLNGAIVPASNILNVRSSTNAQTFNLYNTYTSATSLETFRIKAVAGAAYQIGSAVGSAGGTNRAIEIGHYDSAGTFTSALIVGIAGSLSSPRGGTGSEYFGALSGNASSNGLYNSSFGSTSLTSITTGSSNCSFGRQALQAVTSGSLNSGFGLQALNRVVSGSNNTALGAYAGFYIAGSNNTTIGYACLLNTTGSGSVGVGYCAGQYETDSNAFYVDNQDRTNTAGDKAGALLYGTFNAAPASQTLAINAATTVKGSITLTQPVSTTGSPTAFTVTGAAHTTLTLSTEATDVNFNLARTVQFATGALTTQRAMRIQAPTYSFVGASTITTASTLSISGPPVAGTNATITNAYALNIESGTTIFNGPIRSTVSSNGIYFSDSGNGGGRTSMSGTDFYIDNGSAGGSIIFRTNSATGTVMTLPSTGIVSFNTGVTGASNIFNILSGTSSQTLRVYNTYTSATSYERVNVRGVASANFEIGPENGSAGGTLRGLTLGGYTAGSATITPWLSFTNAGAATFSGPIASAKGIYFTSEPTGTPSGTTQTLTLADGNHQTLALTSATGTVTATLTVPTGSSSGTIIVKQHASAAKDITWAVSAGTIKWMGTEPDWVADAISSVRIVSWRYDGSVMYLMSTDVGA